MSSDMIRYLAREYPTASSYEIGHALGVSVQLVRIITGKSSVDDAGEMTVRKTPGTDMVFVSIMKKRIAPRSQQVKR